ncbi:MAG: ECF-type sigma factor [Acidobacteriota bacterium]|nr:ECF-type sigma factor [Acidobacteriota bacterium]
MEKPGIDPNEVNRLMEEWRQGDREAFDDLFALLYEDIRMIAHRLFRRERDNHTLQTSDLVNKLYLKMLGARNVPWTDYAHFLNATARTMRQILIDHARGWERRADGPGKVPLEDWDQDARVDASVAKALDQLIALDEALKKMTVIDAKMARVADWKLSLGLTLDEIAERLGTPLTNIKREWLLAKKFLGKTVWGMG